MKVNMRAILVVLYHVIDFRWQMPLAKKILNLWKILARQENILEWQNMLDRPIILDGQNFSIDDEKLLDR